MSASASETDRGTFELALARYSQSKSAVLSGAVLLGVCLLAIFGPLISPETFGAFDFHNGGRGPGLDWRYLLGADVYGHSVLADVILGARTTFGIAVIASFVALVIGGLVGGILGTGESITRTAAGWIIDLGLTLPLFPLMLIWVALGAHGNPWSMTDNPGNCGVARRRSCRSELDSVARKEPGRSVEVGGRHESTSARQTSNL